MPILSLFYSGINHVLKSLSCKIMTRFIIEEIELLSLFCWVIGVDGRNWNIRGEPGEVQIQLWQPAGP